MNLLTRTARRVATLLGRDSWMIRTLRPLYEAVLDWTSRGRGILWNINQVNYRIDPRYRHQMGSAYDERVAQWLSARVKPGQVVLDVGANVGVYVLQFAHWTRPNGRVIAVEPNPSARAVLEKHVALNGLEGRVEVVAAAIAAAQGEATFFAAGTEGMSRLAAPNPAIADKSTPIVVPVVTLDKLCAARGLTPDWLFMDIEGMEIAALSGATNLLSTLRSRLGIVLEMHPDAWEVGGTTRRGAEALLRHLRLRAEPLSGQTDPLGTHGHVWLRPG